MTYFALTLIADSPLTIRADHAPGGAASAPYIPGTTLAGSLAAAYRLYYPDDETGFQDLFLSEQVWFPNLYPASFKNDEAQETTTSPVYPLPKTAQSCKRFPGFRSDDYEDRQPHGVRDSLLDWALFRIADDAKTVKPEDLIKLLQDQKECRCRNPLDHFTGYYRQPETGGSRFTAKVKTRLQTRNGINRVTGTVEERILYNRQVIEEDAHFWGLVKVPDDLASSFEKFVKEAGSAEAGWLRVGTGRTRGMGKVGLEAKRLDDRPGIGAFRTRLMDFNALLQRTAKDSKVDAWPF